MTKKEQIIDAAVKEFGEYSYDMASINRVIKASGTSKGTFYHYFSDKKDLYFSIIEKSLEIKQLYFDRMMELVKRKDDIFEVLKAQAKAAAEVMRKDPALYKFGARFAVEENPIRNEVFERIMPQVGDVFSKILETGIKNAKLNYPLDFSMRIINYMTMNYFDILFYKGEVPTIESIESRLDMLFDFMKRGLAG